MPNDSKLLFPQMKRVRQINEYYCAPASLEMMLSFWGLTINQEEIVTAADVSQRIRTHGMLLSEVVTAVNKLAPGYLCWYKREATIGELSSLINTYQLPVGVEWQGIFDNVDDSEIAAAGYVDDDDDPGHYSVITGISTSDNWLTLANPYLNKGTDDQLSILEFERRWWDINTAIDPYTHKSHQIDDYRAMFVITPQTDSTPELFHMISE